MTVINILALAPSQKQILLVVLELMLKRNIYHEDCKERYYRRKRKGKNLYT